MPSFDVVSEVNKVELNNALDQSNKEIANRGGGILNSAKKLNETSETEI